MASKIWLPWQQLIPLIKNFNVKATQAPPKSPGRIGLRVRTIPALVKVKNSQSKTELTKASFLEYTVLFGSWL